MRALSAVATAITVALLVVTALLWLLAPWVIRFYLLLNPASTGSAERALATQLLHYFAPQVFFLGAIVVSTALLNARRHFAAAAFSPVVNNLIAIAALLATKAVASTILTSKTTSPGAVLERISHDQHAIWVLGIGTTVGYVAQLLVQLPAMGRAGFRLRPVWDLHHPAVRRVARLSSWVIGVVIANQISLALVMILAGKVQGGVTAYQFSYQFFQLPYALIAVSVASALMPDLAERWSGGDRRGFERQSVIGLRVTMAVLIPVALAYVAIAQPFIQLAVEHGRVTTSGAHLVGTSLAFFAVGLPGFSAFYLLMRLYQAMQNARVMFWLYALENGLTIVAALVLDQVIGVSGLALAWVAPYTVASFVAAWDLRRRVGSLGGKHTVMALIRILAASALAAGVVVAAGAGVPDQRRRRGADRQARRAGRFRCSGLPGPGQAVRHQGAAPGNPTGSPSGRRRRPTRRNLSGSANRHRMKGHDGCRGQRYVLVPSLFPRDEVSSSPSSGHRAIRASRRRSAADVPNGGHRDAELLGAGLNGYRCPARGTLPPARPPRKAAEGSDRSGLSVTAGRPPAHLRPRPAARRRRGRAPRLAAGRRPSAGWCPTWRR